MKASETNLFKFLEGNKQFIIPIYQRTYSWSQEECEQLWNDIVRAATTPSITAHFVGSIVYIQQGLYQAADVSQMLVIDGQQRLTTLTLLLAALVREGAQSGINPKKIINSYLTNPDEEGEKTYKLLLTQSDRQTLISVVNALDLPKIASPRIVENFQFFVERIRASAINPQEIYAGIGKLVLVDIALDRDHDNPQLIFESMNSTGMDLSQTDLIRNYILMRLAPEHQTRLYNQHWFPMEQLFGPARYASHFDLFMRDYLTIKRRAIPNLKGIYKVFKTYREEGQKDTDIDTIVADIHHFARLYVRLAFNEEQDPVIKDAIRDINDIEVNVAYPVLLEAYDDFVHERLSKEDFVALIRLVESYVVRRAICEIGTYSINKTFATIMRDVDKTQYLGGVEAAFMALGSYRRFPRDDEFKRYLEIKDVYHFQRRNYLLRKLENYGRKERVVVEGFTIEHIMPQNQNLPPVWRQTLGPNWKDIHNRYLHSIGNLTLTGYNSEMSDRSFQDKRDMPKGFKQSPLYLNEGLGQCVAWNEEAIQQRAAHLANRAILVWAVPTDTNPLSNMNQLGKAGEKYELEHYAQYSTSAQLRELFLALRHRILQLDTSVLETRFKYAIGFGIPDQFANIQLRQRQISVEFSRRLDRITDPDLHIIRSNPQTGRAQVRYALKSSETVGLVLSLIEDSLLLKLDSEDDGADPVLITSNGDEASAEDE